MLIQRFLRSFFAHPGFTGVAITTLALGLAAVLTIYSLVDGVLLRALPYPESDRLVSVDHTAPALNLPTMGSSRGLYLHYLATTTSFDEIGLFDGYRVTLTGEGEPVRAQASSVTPSFFRVLGTTPRLGRTFSEAEGRPGSNANVAVIAHGLFEQRFGGDPTVTSGGTMQIDGVTHQIIGVMPQGFAFPFANTDLWRVRQLDAASAPLGSFNDQLFARLRDGVSIEQARADLEQSSHGLEQSFPEDSAAPILDRSGFTATIETLLDRTVGDTRDLLWVLLATVAVILLIACANVANLYLVRVEERGHELAVRAALGAGGRRLIGQLMAESLALAGVAGVLALTLATLALRLIKSYGPTDLPRIHEVAIDARVMAFAVAVSLFAGALFGLLPALRAARGHGARAAVLALREGGRGTAGRERHRLRTALVTAQVALGLLLLVGSGLMFRSLQQLANVDPGFVADDTLTFQLTLPESKYPEGEERVRFAETVIERVQALPGIDAVAVGSTTPMSGVGNGSGYSVRDQPTTDDSIPPVFMQAHTGPGYLETIGVRTLAGRLPAPDDYQNRRGNVVVTKNLADRFWPDTSALGKEIAPGTRGAEDRWLKIVGIVDNVHQFGNSVEAPLLVFLPLLDIVGENPQDLGGNLSFVVDSQLASDTVLAQIRNEIWSIDPEVPLTSVQTLEDILHADRAERAFSVTVLGIASGLALLLAALGLYGVVSYVVTRRTRELGVRMALGAQQSDIATLVVRSGVTVAVAGIVIGTVVAVGLTRFLESLLFEVNARDPVVFGSVALVLLAVTCIAVLLPALRASRVDPMIALRHE